MKTGVWMWHFSIFFVFIVLGNDKWKCFVDSLYANPEVNKGNIEAKE